MTGFADTILWPAVSGSAAWFATKLILNPIFEIYDLRKRAHQSIIFTSNVSEIQGREAVVSASARLREVACELQAATESLNPVSKWWFRKRHGYDLLKAGAGLIGLSNSLFDSAGGRLLHKDSVSKALKLPSEVDEKTIEMVKSSLGRPTP
jgi:hypothetical protein